MAVIFPEGIYTAGQGIFDARPYMKDIEARKKAKEEAFTKYFDKIKTQVNTAGVRDVDLPFIEKEIEELGRFGVANKKPIGRNGPEKLVFEKMARNIFQRIEGSKGAQKRNDEFAKAQFADKTEDDMEIYDRNQLSIYDPKHYKEYYVNEAQGLPEYKETRGTPFSLADLTPAVNTLKPTERTKYIEASFGPKEQKMTIDINTPVQRVGNQYVYTTKYTDSVIKKGAENYASNVKEKPIDKESRRFKKAYNSLMDDAEWMAKADAVFQKYYGKPIENVRDAAAADALLYYDALKGEKTSTIPQPRVGRAGTGKGSQAIDEDLFYLSDEVAADAGQLLDIKKADGTKATQTVVFVKDIDPKRLNIIIGRDLKKGQFGVKPAKIAVLQPDGTYRDELGYYVDNNTKDWYGEAGQPKISRERVKDDYMNIVNPTLAKAKIGTKAAEKITPTQAPQSRIKVGASAPKQTFKGTNKKMY